MINTWWFNIIIYLILYVVFTQSYKLATKSSKHDGALTVLLQFLGGIIVLLFIPLFKMQFPTNIKTYIFLLIACAFYAINDRINTTTRKGLEVSTHSMLSQLSTVFIITWGILFFKEPIVIKKIIGGLLIVAGNIFVLYKKGKFEFNKYVLLSLLCNIVFSIAISIDVGISDQFNLPIYVAITLLLPSLLVLLFNRIKIRDVVSEYKTGNKKAILLVVFSWGIMIIEMIRSYQFGSVTTIAPIAAVTTILNVFIAYFVLKEKENMLRKVIAAINVVLVIILVKI